MSFIQTLSLKSYDRLKSLANILKSPFVPLFLLVLIDHIGHGIFFPILVSVFMSDDGILGPNASSLMKSFYYNLTLSIFPIMLYFGATLMGGLSDRFGRRKILVICLAGAGLSYLIAGLAIIIKNLPLLIFSRVIAGITSGTMPIAQAATIDLSDEKNSAQNLGWLISASSLGFLMGPLLAGFCSDASLIPWFSYSTPFFIAATLAFINLVLLYFFFQETFKPKAVQGSLFKKCLEFAIAPFIVKKIRFLSIIFLILQLGWSFYFQYVAIYLLKKHQYESQDLSLFMSMMGIGFALGSSWLLRTLAKIFSDKKSAILSLIIGTLCIFLMTIALNDRVQFAFSFIIGATMASLYALLIKFYSNTVSKEEQGWVMGVSEAMVAIAWGITPLLATYLEQWSLTLPIYTASLLLFLCLALLQKYKEPTQHAETRVNLPTSQIVL